MSKNVLDMRKDKKENKVSIKNAMLDHIEKNSKAPTIEQLSKVVKLSTKTVERHLKEISLFGEDNIYRILTPDVVKAVYENAISNKVGSHSDRKLWLQVFEGFSERKIITGKDGQPVVTGIQVTIIDKKEALRELEDQFET